MDIIKVKREFVLENNDKVIFYTDDSAIPMMTHWQATGKERIIKNEIDRKRMITQPVAIDLKDSNSCRKILKESFPKRQIISEWLGIKFILGERIIEAYFYASDDKQTACKLVTNDILDVADYISETKIGDIDNLLFVATKILEKKDISELERKWKIYPEKKVIHHEQSPS